MKTLALITMALLLAASPAIGELVEVKHEDLPTQDPLFVPEVVHELGINFPEGQLIRATDQLTDYRPCPEMPDSPDIPNALVEMTNLTGRSWTRVWYVGDGPSQAGAAPETTLQNYDGTVNQGLAFLIDNVGINRPLLAEVGGIPGDNIWQPNETWEFVIQDYRNVMGLPPSALDSVGLVGSGSAGLEISSGSIIAIPEPVTMSLLGLGGLGALLRRRRKN